LGKPKNKTKGNDELMWEVTRKIAIEEKYREKNATVDILPLA